jgi:uncharacterized DUF497 family protein
MRSSISWRGGINLPIDTLEGISVIPKWSLSEFVARFADEPRLGLVGEYEEKLWTAIFTVRAERVRIISVRRARKNEEATYHDSEGV